MNILRHCFHGCVSTIVFIFSISTAWSLISFLSRQDNPKIEQILNERPETSKPDEQQETLQETSTNIIRLLLWDLILIYIFINQHSFMAHEKVKSFMSAVGLGIIQRSIYVGISCLILNLMVAQWVTVDRWPLWLMDTRVRAGNEIWWWWWCWWVFTILHGAAWLVTYGGCILMDLAELLGVKQVYYAVIGLNEPTSYKSQELQRLYTHMRHPSFLGLTVVLLIHPHMTLDRLLLALVLIVYMMAFFRVDSDDYAYQKTQLTRKREQEFTYQYVGMRSS